MVEIALLGPWIFFLFIGVFDSGFYAYATISVEGAVRAAASRTAQDTISQTQQIACDAATAEMIRLPNYRSFSANCGGGTVTVLSASNPLLVTQQTLCGTAVNTFSIPACSTTGLLGGPLKATTPICADCSNDRAAASSLVTVAYQSVQLVPIPGILTGLLKVTRRAEVRIDAP